MIGDSDQINRSQQAEQGRLWRLYIVEVPAQKRERYKFRHWLSDREKKAQKEND